MENIFSVKILFLGDSNVGKTSLMMAHFNPIAPTSSPARTNHHVPTGTVGCDFKVSTVKTVINKKPITVNFQIWDTAGQEKFRSIIRAFYRGANAVFLVFDLHNMESFMSLDSWIKDLNEYCNTEPIIILIGNKSDLPHRVKEEDIQKFTKNYRISSYIETSAVTQLNVREMFETVAQRIIVTDAPNSVFVTNLTQTNLRLRNDSVILHSHPSPHSHSAAPPTETTSCCQHG